MKKFFIVCPLGFELATAAEIRQAWPLLIGKDGKDAQTPALAAERPLPELKVEKGGIELQCAEVFGYQLNFFLKTASRVLLRLAAFKARDFPKLHDKIRALPWGEYFSSSNLNYEISASKSRINHEGRIEETLVKTLKNILKSTSEAPQGSVYVRVFEDLCTVSLDTTGEHLHKRAWATLKGEAPLRESIVAFILMKLIGDRPAEELKQITLCDPMMGSGSFLLEGRSLFFPNFARPFAFQKFKSCPKIFLSPSFPLNYKLPQTDSFKAYIGADIAPKMVADAQLNWESLEKEIEKVQRKSFVKADIQWRQQDLFATVPAELSGHAARTWIVANPPYGERLQDLNDGSIEKYFTTLAAAKPELMAILYPAKSPLRPASCPAGYKISAEIPILNGGLKTLLTVLKKTPQ